MDFWIGILIGAVTTIIFGALAIRWAMKMPAGHSMNDL